MVMLVECLVWHLAHKYSERSDTAVTAVMRHCAHLTASPYQALLGWQYVSQLTGTVTFDPVVKVMSAMTIINFSFYVLSDKKLQHSEQNKSHCVYGKVCKHMNKPGGIYVVVKLVEKIEDAPADNKPQQQQQQHLWWGLRNLELLL